MWGNYEQIENDADMVTTHSVTLSGLSGNTFYYFRAGSTDAAGNGPSVSKEVGFTTNPDPDIAAPQIISPPTVTTKTEASATIEWDTNEPSNSLIHYGLASGAWASYALSEEDSVFVTHHSVTITGLDNIPVVVAGVEYEYDDEGNIIAEIPITTTEYVCTEGNCKFYFRVGSTDAAGNGPVTSTEVTFTTKAVPDTAPPEITAPPTVTVKTHESATITWSTNEPSNSQVAYGTSSKTWDDYPLAENDSDFVTTHSVTLTKLSDSTKYYLRVGATDAAGNGPVTSNEVTFTTQQLPDETAPRITIPPTVTDKTVGYATIEWQTDEPSTSEVRYGGSDLTWDLLPYVESDSEMATSHSVTLTGLDNIIGCESGGCLFYFMVGSTDAAGNGPDPLDTDSNNPFTLDTFVTQIAPDEKAPKVISGPAVTAVDGYSAIIEWQTDEPSNSIVRYDIITNVWDTYALSEDDSALVTNHSVTITGLLGSTTYYYRVGSTDAQGNGPELNQDSSNPTPETTLVTANVADTGPPQLIENSIKIAWVTNQTALIEWATDEPSNSLVAYNTSSGTWDSYPFAENDAGMFRTHSTTLTNLQPSTRYYFRVVSTDAKGNVSTPSSEFQFITSVGPDVTAPQISNVHYEALSASSAVVTWNTDEPGNSQVRYATQSSNWNAYDYSENDAEMVRQHTVTLTGLSPSTLYYMRVSSTDASGNNYTTSIYDDNPSIEYNLTTGNAVPPSILVYPDASFPKIDYGKNTIDITYDKPNMQKADVYINYLFSPELSFTTRAVPVQLISSTADTSTYRLSFVGIPKYTIITLTVTEEITDADGCPVEPKTVVINDRDADNLPDDWEITMGLDPESADSTTGEGRDGDFDGDGYSNYEEFLNGTDPKSSMDFPPAPAYLESIPHDGAGIDDTLRVANSASFAVLIEDESGIDVKDPGSVTFTIADNTESPYAVDLSHPNVRTMNLNHTDNDGALTQFWVVYTRDAGDEWPWLANIRVSVAATNQNNWQRLATYRFKIESEIMHLAAENDKPDFSSIGTEDPDVSGEYDMGWKVESGDLAGAKIIFNSSEWTDPTFGPTRELPIFDIANSSRVGVSINLQPPTIFSTPVKLIIPTPGIKNTANVRIYVFDGQKWVLGCDRDEREYKEGWYVPGSRINGKDRVEIKVYHFSGVQAAIIEEGIDGSGTVSGKAETSCFVEAVMRNE